MPSRLTQFGWVTFHVEEGRDKDGNGYGSEEAHFEAGAVVGVLPMQRNLNSSLTSKYQVNSQVLIRDSHRVPIIETVDEALLLIEAAFCK